MVLGLAWKTLILKSTVPLQPKFAGDVLRNLAKAVKSGKPEVVAGHLTVCPHNE